MENVGFRQHVHGLEQVEGRPGICRGRHYTNDGANSQPVTTSLLAKPSDEGPVRLMPVKNNASMSDL